MTEMTSSSLIEILRLLEAADIPVWLDGGWGVDALLEERSRPHKDVDLVLQVSDVPAVRALLEKHGFALKQGSPPNSFVLANKAGLEVDVHAVGFDKHATGTIEWKTAWIGFTQLMALAGKGLLMAIAFIVCHPPYRCCVMRKDTSRSRKTSEIWSC